MTGGRFFEVGARETLYQALKSALGAGYRLDGAGEEVVIRGVLGPVTAAVPAGVYRLVVETDPPIVVEGVAIRPRGRPASTWPGRAR